MLFITKLDAKIAAGESIWRMVPPIAGGSGFVSVVRRRDFMDMKHDTAREHQETVVKICHD